MVVDATGLDWYGEGEWKVRTHGPGKRGAWRKLHPVVDEADNRILGVVLTTKDFKDSQVLPKLMNQIDTGNITRGTGDGAYDHR